MAAIETSHSAIPENDRFSVVDLGATRDDFAEDVRRGLTSAPKMLPPKYFYDKLGSILFEAICDLPEYYVTRAEDEILAHRSDEIVLAMHKPLRLVELGCGVAAKTRWLIRAALSRQANLAYVPIDIDAATLRATCESLVAEHTALTVRAIAGTFEDGLTRLEEENDWQDSTVVLFLGSTIGNMEPEVRRDLFRRVRRILRAGDAILLGADLDKPVDILIPAYDDALGVTAAFNLNLLARMNRELRAAFDLKNFRHHVRYDAVSRRIEMHLVSTTEQSVSIDGLGIVIQFADGESIHTENSYKFSDESVEHLASDSGFRVREKWTDSKRLFADYLLEAV